jgi:hypothetical protein
MALFTSNPTAFTTPAPGVFGVDTVLNPTNTQHDATLAQAGGGVGTPTDVGVSIEWRSFVLPPGAVLSINLRFNWSTDGFNFGSPFTPLHEIDYSLNNGGSWTVLVFDSDVDAPASGSINQSIPATQDISQIRVRNIGLASVADEETENAGIQIEMNSVRLEIVVADNAPICIF